MSISLITGVGKNNYDIIVDSLNVNVDTPVHQNGLTIGGKPLQFGEMTTAARTALVPADGLTVYDSDIHSLYTYSNGSWGAIGGGGGGVSTINSNGTLTITNGSGPTVTAAVHDPLTLGSIGTTDNLQSPQLQLLANGGGGSFGYTYLNSPASAYTPYTLTVPNGPGTSGQVLTTNGANPAVLSWTSNGSGSGTVTSVASSTTSTNVIELTGSPVTTSGTLGVSLNGITGLGTANQALCTNAGASALEWQTVSGGGGITSLTSTGSTLTLTNPSGPTCNAEVTDPLVLNTITASSNLYATSGFNGATGSFSSLLTCNCPLALHTSPSNGTFTLQAQSSDFPSFTCNAPSSINALNSINGTTSLNSASLCTDTTGNLFFASSLLIGSARGLTFSAINSIANVMAALPYNIYVKDVLIFITTGFTGGPDLSIGTAANAICTFNSAALNIGAVLRASNSSNPGTLAVLYDAVINNAPITIRPSSGSFTAGTLNIMIEYITA